MQELLDAVAAFVAERDWEHFHTPGNLAKSISIEAAELLEHFQWRDCAWSEVTVDAMWEAADVMIYLLAFMNRMGVKEKELTDWVREKININAEKYPVETSKGKA